MRSHRRACRKTCEQYGALGARLPGPDTAGLRGDGVAVEALQFSVEVHGKDTFLRGKLRGVGQSVVPLAEELLPVVAAAIRTVGGCRLKTVFQVIAERAAAFHRLAEGVAGCGCTRPVPQSSAPRSRQFVDQDSPVLKIILELNDVIVAVVIAHPV